MSYLNFALEDLFVAYRKAKNEVFHEKLQVSILSFPAYEEHLESNLIKLLDKINSQNFDFVTAENFQTIDSYYTIVKKIHYSNGFNSNENVYYSNLQDRWKEKTFEIDKIDFRVISDLSVEFHIISSLWIDKVAFAYENNLTSSSFGSRLISVDNKPPKSSNHFKPYIHAYRSWQVKGLNRIRESLENIGEAIALTADIKSFYHHIDINFLLADSFWKQFGKYTTLSKEQSYLNHLLVKAIDHWSKLTYVKLSTASQAIYPDQNHVGIPIGLAASKVVANLLLKEFDDAIEQDLMPFYYGRYVDDIFLVLDYHNAINSRKKLWNYLSKRIPKIKFSDSSTSFNLKYGGKTKIDFNTTKERIFFLDKVCGMSIVNEIEKELNENSSEWRMLPDVENDLDQFSEEVLQATKDATETPNSLRKSDGISIRRLKYALFVRSAEELVLTHPRYFWKQGLNSLLKMTANFATDPEILPDYLQYIVRIMRLAIYTGNRINLQLLLNSISSSIDSIDTWFGDQDIEINSYKTFLRRGLELAYYTGWNFTSNWEGNNEITTICQNWGIILNEDRVCRFFLCDLHLVSLNSIIDYRNGDIVKYYKKIAHMDELKNFYIDDDPESLGFVPFGIIQSKLKDVGSIFQNMLYSDSLEEFHLPIGIFILTRRLNYLDITFILEDWLHARHDLFNSLTRLFDLPILQILHTIKDNYCYIDVSQPYISEDPLVAITSYQIDDESWQANVLGLPEPDMGRLKRLYDLVTGVLSVKDRKIGYIILPELSVPRFAIHMISRQLRGSGITLIAGAEYSKDLTAKIFKNQMIIILPVEQHGLIRYVQIVQQKVIPAIHEETDLYNLAGVKLDSSASIKYIITRNSFTFSGLICNDFLNIDYRQNLRGKIDALFLIEWNKDIETYNSLVESTANDLHSYIVQVNNRSYGDTRVRAPFKEPYKRDVARIRGGLLDYFVLCKLDVYELRLFQMNNISPKAPFKPTPTGFVMDDKRKLKKMKASK